MSNKRSQIIRKNILLAVIIVFTVFLSLYIGVVSGNNGENIHVSVYDTGYDIEIQPGMILEYEFTCERDAIRAVVLRFAHEDATITGAVVVNLIDCGNSQIIGSSGVPAVSTLNGDDTTFDMMNIITGLRGKRLKVQVMFENVTEGQLKLQGQLLEGGNSQFDIAVISAGKDAFLTILKLVYAVVILTILGVGICVFYKKDFKIEKAYLISAIGLGIAINLCIPLWSAPDEIVHNYKAYEVSNDMLGIDLTENGTLMMRTDDAVARYVSIKLTRTDYNNYYEHFFDKVSDKTLIDSGIVPEDTPKYLFFLSGLGITIGRLCGCGTTLTFMLGRLFNMLGFILITYYAMKKMPFGKAIIYVWATLPIMLQQTGSFSYDCIINALSVLVISLTLKLMYGGEGSRKDKGITIALLIMAALLLAPCKSFALLPVAVFPFALIVKIICDNGEKISEYFKNHKKLKLGLIICMALVCLAVIFVGMRVISVVLAGADGNGAYVAYKGEYAYPLGHFIKHPKEIIGKLIDTLWICGDDYFLQLLGGSLGWLTIDIPVIFILPYFLLLLYAGCRREDEAQPISVASKAWMWIVFVGTCSLAMIAMLLYWTTKYDSVICGVQGRYFLPALVLPVLTIRTKHACVNKEADRVVALLVPILCIFVVTTILRYSF